MKAHNGSTPLHRACATGLEDVVKILVWRRADVTLKTDKGKGILELASHSSPTVAQWLTENTAAKWTYTARTSNNRRYGGEDSQSKVLRRATCTKNGGAWARWEHGKGKGRK